MSDIPIQNGPQAGDNTLPEWARSSLEALHTSIANIYEHLLFQDVAEIHKAEAMRLNILNTTTANLATQIEAGFTPTVFQRPICDGCKEFCTLTFDGKCQACGHDIMHYTETL